jgi:hypothetical protein
VVTEDLVQLDEALAVLLQPRGEALVEIGARGFREGVVGCVADEQVTKAVRVVAREPWSVGADELLSDKGNESLVKLAVALHERCDGTAVEGSAFNRAPLEN